MHTLQGPRHGVQPETFPSGRRHQTDVGIPSHFTNRAFQNHQCPRCATKEQLDHLRRKISRKLKSKTAKLESVMASPGDKLGGFMGMNSVPKEVMVEKLTKKRDDVPFYSNYTHISP